MIILEALGALVVAVILGLAAIYVLGGVLGVVLSLKKDLEK